MLSQNVKYQISKTIRFLIFSANIFLQPPRHPPRFPLPYVYTPHLLFCVFIFHWVLIRFLCRIDTDSLQVFGDYYPGTMFQENDERKINFQRAFVNFPNNIVFHYLIIICFESLHLFPLFLTAVPRKCRRLHRIAWALNVILCFSQHTVF